MSNLDDGDAKTRTVGILVFDDVEVMDVMGPFEVFSVTRLDETNRDFTESPFKVLLLSNDMKPIKAIGGLKLQPDYIFENSPSLDLFIVPGGRGTRTEVNNDKLIQKILNISQKSSITATICTGSSLLGKTGLLDGQFATTHWRAYGFLEKSAPKAKIEKKVLFTINQKIFTSAGVTSGISLALYLVSYFYGLEVGKATAKFMEFPYPDHNINLNI
ncbi:MAG: DJ-1/PfpI family protein [Candidatus Nitrosocosmicus sp.]|jgi:transcriptional regulator GlxA family with amidase domain|nr:DJ-1/PfpI family protein [Candidatus Nitrosocosmicus sp.]